MIDTRTALLKQSSQLIETWGQNNEYVITFHLSKIDYDSAADAALTALNLEARELKQGKGAAKK